MGGREERAEADTLDAEWDGQHTITPLKQNSETREKKRDCYLRPISKLLRSHFLFSDACLLAWFAGNLILLILPPYVHFTSCIGLRVASCGENGEKGGVVSTEVARRRSEGKKVRGGEVGQAASSCMSGERNYVVGI